MRRRCKITDDGIHGRTCSLNSLGVADPSSLQRSALRRCPVDGAVPFADRVALGQMQHLERRFFTGKCQARLQSLAHSHVQPFNGVGGVDSVATVTAVFPALRSAIGSMPLASLLRTAA